MHELICGFVLSINEYIPCLTCKHSDRLRTHLWVKFGNVQVNYTFLAQPIEVAANTFVSLLWDPLSFSKDMVNMVNHSRPSLTILIVTIASSANILSPLHFAWHYFPFFVISRRDWHVCWFRNSMINIPFIIWYELLHTPLGRK